MAPVTFSPKARLDLLDIGDYIAKDSRANARRFVGKLVDQCVRIGEAPLGYPSRQELAADLRVAPLGSYLIFFRVVDSAVRIERVLHGARDLPAVLRLHEGDDGE
jgi:toxin ParE1/3/4